MLKRISLAAAALAMTAGGIAATPASAQYYGGDYQGSRYDRSYNDGYRGYDRGYGYDNRGYDRGYYNRGYNDRGYYNDSRRYRSNRCDNTGGTVLGAIAGGLLGSAVAGRRDQGLGIVLGAGAGALAGNQISKSGKPYCR